MSHEDGESKIYVADRPMGLEISDDDGMCMACDGSMVQKADLETGMVVHLFTSKVSLGT